MNALRIYVAGGETLLGQALRRRLHRDGRCLVGEPLDEPDLTRSEEVAAFFADARPDCVLLCAGATGGIGENQRRPADLMLHNLLVTAHVIEHARRHRVGRLLYVASSCSYPIAAPQPLHADALLTGPLEPTSRHYALAKLAGWQLCDACRIQDGVSFVTVVPANSFGPYDDFSPESGHVIPALIRRMHDAREQGRDSLTIWGSGAARREFIFSDDLADACVFVMERYDGAAPINIGSGAETSIADLARLVADVVGYRGQLIFDARKPDGMPRKALDSAVLRGLGWRARTPLRAALEETYAWFHSHPIREDADARAVV